MVPHDSKSDLPLGTVFFLLCLCTKSLDNIDISVMAHDKISNEKDVSIVIVSQNRKENCLEEHVHFTFLIPWIVFVGHTRLPKSVKSLQKTLYKDRSVLIFVSMIHFPCMPHRELG